MTGLDGTRGFRLAGDHAAAQGARGASLSLNSLIDPHLPALWLIHVRSARTYCQESGSGDRPTQRQPDRHFAAHGVTGDHGTRPIERKFAQEGGIAGLDFLAGDLQVIPTIGVFPHCLGGLRRGDQPAGAGSWLPERQRGLRAAHIGVQAEQQGAGVGFFLASAFRAEDEQGEALRLGCGLQLAI